jgi:preprotein translocase subunit SecE
VARNRKRAKERRARRPGNGSEPQPGITTARLDAPGPIEHASPDVELAEAQLALGRPELEPDAEPEPVDDISDDAESEPLDDQEFGEGPAIPGILPEQIRVESDGDAGTEVLAAALPAAEPAERRARPGNRLIHFLQGSWRELQRVQWPDRRQVMQATGVVIGFVIVAGVFLGVADFLAGKLVTYILK